MYCPMSMTSKMWLQVVVWQYCGGWWWRCAAAADDDDGFLQPPASMLLWRTGVVFGDANGFCLIRVVAPIRV